MSFIHPYLHTFTCLLNTFYATTWRPGGARDLPGMHVSVSVCKKIKCFSLFFYRLKHNYYAGTPKVSLSGGPLVQIFPVFRLHQVIC
jgi:hypothetical protein